MSEEEIEKIFNNIPKTSINEKFTSFGAINVDDFKSAMKRLDKIPNTNDLLKENKILQDKINKAIEYINNKDTIYEYSSASGEESMLDIHKKELLKILKGK